MASPQSTEAYQWQGRTMIGSDDQKIGNITHIYEDPQTGHPEWATVSTGIFGSKSHFVPLAGAVTAGQDIQAQVTKRQVKDAPGVEDDGELSAQEEQRLFEHYGVPYTPAGTATQEQPSGGHGSQQARHEDGHDTSKPNAEDAMTRSDDLQVGLQQGGSGRARLRKYVVTETVIENREVSEEVQGALDTDGTERGPSSR